MRRATQAHCCGRARVRAHTGAAPRAPQTHGGACARIASLTCAQKPNHAQAVARRRSDVAAAEQQAAAGRCLDAAPGAASGTVGALSQRRQQQQQLQQPQQQPQRQQQRQQQQRQQPQQQQLQQQQQDAAFAQAPAEPPADPFAQRTTYADSRLDLLFIRLFTQKIADQLGAGAAPLPQRVGYDDFVAVSRAILRGRSTAQQHALVRRVLLSLLPPGLPALCKRVFRPTQWAAEVNAAAASVGFAWLVGESELRSCDVQVAPGVTRQQRSVVHIKRCRYLEASGCVGLCTNMCKVPTQSFFTDDFGMPLTMNPDFETLSCDMIFGQAPPALADDAVASQPCFVHACSAAPLSAAADGPCSKLFMEAPRFAVEAALAHGEAGSRSSRL